jgi:hypothetical protein
VQACTTPTRCHMPRMLLQEFLTATVFLGKLQRRENLMAAFQHFDGDGSGFICEDELLVVRREWWGGCGGVGAPHVGDTLGVATDTAHCACVCFVPRRRCQRRVCRWRPCKGCWTNATGTTTGTSEGAWRQTAELSNSSLLWPCAPLCVSPQSTSCLHRPKAHRLRGVCAYDAGRRPARPAQQA